VSLLLAVLARLGVVSVDEAELETAFERLAACAEAWGIAVPTSQNRAKQLALRVHGTTAIVVGTAVLEAAARRWASQLNENAKQWAIHAALPEADHNLIVGFAHPEVGGRPHAIVLDALALDRRDRLHIGLTEKALREGGGSWDTVLIDAESAVGALLEACHLGDWVSLYVAALNRVDPMAVDALGTFKQRLTELWDAGEPPGR
jgi:glucose/mannose-6-phosphate isomerase